MKHATKSFELINIISKKKLAIVAIKHTIGIGSSISSFLGPSSMDDEKQAENLSANEPWQVLVKKRFLMEEMIAGCMKGCFVFSLPA